MVLACNLMNAEFAEAMALPRVNAIVTETRQTRWACAVTALPTKTATACDSDELAGCTDSAACNYNSDATEDDGSCDYCSCAGESTGGEASGYTLTIEEHAADVLPGQTTYRFYIDVVNADDFVSSVYGNDGYPMALNTENGFYNDPFGATVASGINPAFIAVFPTIAVDSWITIGIEADHGR